MTASDRRSQLRSWAAWLRPLGDAILPVTMLRGRARNGSGPAALLVAGSLARVAWLVDAFFAEAPVREALGHVPAWRLLRTLRRHAASTDLVVARVARKSGGALGFDDDWLAVPDWVGMRIAAPFDLAAIAKRSHSVADDLRRMRRAGFTHAFSRHGPDLAVFHRDYYLPFMRNRHGDEAVVRSSRRLRRRFRRGGILWIHRGGERVAGVLIEFRRGVLAALAIGVARGDAGIVREGAFAAIYRALLDHAQRSGCTAVDLRGSRPSPLDGLTRYKRKWGALLYDRADVVSTIFVRWQSMTPAVSAFLARTPLIFRDGDALSVIGTVDENDPASSRRALCLPELKRRILAARDTPAEPFDRASEVAVAPLDPEAGPRTLLRSALLRPG